MHSNVKILLFKLQNCDPCTQLADFINTGEMEALRPSIDQYLASDDISPFKKYRVSGAPQVVILQNGLELQRAKGFDDCVGLLRRVLEDDY